MANLLVNGYNVGTELTAVTLLGANGVSIPFEEIAHLETISIKQEQTKSTITPALYGGKRLHRNIYHDWSGSIRVSRFNGDFTNLINNIMTNFQSGGGESYFSLYWNVLNTTLGTLDEYQLLQVVLDDHDAGEFSGISEVKQSIMFRSQALIIIGSGANVLQSGPTITSIQG